jgi:uncharacterized protein (TIGR00730 family)
MPGLLESRPAAAAAVRPPENPAMKKPKPIRVPAPPHPRLRERPLPGCAPKPPIEDPDAPRRLKAILDSPTYRPADDDARFLARDELRGVRLQLDYLKAQLVLEENDVRNTIVVFGSTRIPEPTAAMRRVDELGYAAEKAPGDEDLAHQLAVARRILLKSRYYDVAREFGRLVASTDHRFGDERAVIMTGGGPGIMEAANRGAFDTGAESVGLNITLPSEQFPNPYVTPELCFRFHYFALRKLHFMLRARALVAFPGGYGTFDELFEVLTLIQTRTVAPIPVVLVGEEYWSRAVDFDYLVEEGVIDPEDRSLFWHAETAEEIWNGILAWHAANGEPLISAA